MQGLGLSISWIVRELVREVVSLGLQQLPVSDNGFFFFRRNIFKNNI